MAKQNVKLAFPFKGIVENSAYSEQQPLTTFDALNVRPFDALKLRLRGGQRFGIEKYLATAVNGSEAIQNINDIVLPFSSATPTGTQLLRKYSDTSISLGDLDVVDPGVWELYSLTGDNFNIRVEGTSNTAEVQAASAPMERSLRKPLAGDSLTTICLYDDSPAINPTTLTTYDMTFRGQLRSFLYAVSLVWRVATTPTDDNHFQIRMSTSGGTITASPHRLDAGAVSSPTLDSGSTSWTPSGAGDDYYDYILRVTGNTFTLFAEGVQRWSFTDATHSANTRFGWGVSDPLIFNITDSAIIGFGTAPATAREHNITVTAGGNIYTGSSGAGLALATGTQPAVATSGIVRSASAFNKIFFVDGTSGGYKILDTDTGAISDWQASITGGALPTGGTGVGVSVTAVDTGTKTFTVVEDKSSLSSGDFIEIRDSSGNDRSYTVASTSGTGPTVITVNETIPSSVVDGDLYVSDVGCRMIVLYHNRIVVAGLETDAQNFFMAKFGNPLDFDYSASSTVTIALAGNTNQAGTLDDIITALMPYLDDVLYIGGDHTLWAMQGDPADEGSIDNVSRQLGVIGPDAWTFDETGNMYFLAQNGLYHLRAGSTSIESISKGRLDDTLTSIDFGANNVTLQYDRETQGVHIFIVPTTEGASPNDQWFWDKRTDSFWRDQYPTSIGPTAVHLFDSDSFDDRAIALGGRDSFIRSFSRTAKSDDGTAIDSYVYFTPFTAGDRSRMLLQEIQINLAEESDSNMVLQVFEAATAEDVTTETVPKAATTLTEGRNNPMLTRVAGNSIAIRIRDNTLNSSWAYENGSVVLDGAGIERRGETK